MIKLMSIQVFPRIRKRPCRGASAIEFALMLPLLLLLLFGIIETSIALYDKAIITNASREAARAGVVMSKTRLSDSEIEQVALSYCGNRLISFGALSSAPKVTVQRPASPMTNDPLTVSIAYTYSGFGLGRLYAAWVGPIQLTATTVMTYE
ncbi:MAG: pilus assembly protein [Burkholderiaceae bacterium]|nr:pilus assembly protein [Burkholderiaceae bacterium]